MSRYHTRIEVDGVEDVPVTVEYDANPPSKGRTDGKHGPAIEPDDPGGIEINSVTLADGREITLTSDGETRMEEEIQEWRHGMYDQDQPEMEYGQ